MSDLLWPDGVPSSIELNPPEPLLSRIGAFHWPTQSLEPIPHSSLHAVGSCALQPVFVTCGATLSKNENEQLLETGGELLPLPPKSVSGPLLADNDGDFLADLVSVDDDDS